MAKILIIDDEKQFCALLTTAISGLGHQADSAGTLRKGLLATERTEYDVVYLDVGLPDGSGLAEIKNIRNSVSAPEVIIMTGGADPDGAELAIRNGAWDYIAKPSSISSMLLPMLRALQCRQLRAAARPAAPLQREGLIGESRKFRVTLEQIARIAGSDVSVLITGETGTGKELAALALHSNSPRAGRDFIVVDCASLSESLVENMLFGHSRGAYTGADSSHEGLVRQADGGTLFLDEIGELPLAVQKSFLRVLQERRFRPLGAAHEIESDFRLIAATNRDLDQMVETGKFRSDLLYRVRSLQIDLPPLRERSEDIVEIAAYHLKRIGRRYHAPAKSLSPELEEMLTAYPWPGNVRELVNTIEMTVAMAVEEEILLPHHLPEQVRIKAARTLIARGVSRNLSAAEGREEQPARFPAWNEYRNEAIAAAERNYLRNLLQLSGNDVKKSH